MKQRSVKRRYEIDMCNGSIADKILLFALPLMASSLLQLLFNAADVVVVGKFAGKEALAAVGSNTALINLLINLFVGLSVGTNVVVARRFGGRAPRQCEPQRPHLHDPGAHQWCGHDGVRHSHGPPAARVDVLPHRRHRLGHRLPAHLLLWDARPAYLQLWGGHPAGSGGHPAVPCTFSFYPA